MKLSRLLAVFCVFIGYGAPAEAAFDSSEYRQNTYGPPTHYCDPTRPLNSAGAGTLANPWNLNQAMTLAVAGNVVGFFAGVGVRLPSSDNNRFPTFRPTNSGTAANRIVFVTRFAAVALANVATNPNRTQLRHDGTPAVANGSNDDLGTASPMYGVYQTDYVTFDGFFVDMAEAEPTGDGGVIRVENARGVHFRNFEIKGTTTNMGTNPIIYRPQNAIGTVLSNFRVYDFHNDTTNSSTPQRGLFSDQYGDQGFLIEHFEIRNTQTGIFLKGTAGGAFNYGTIRYGIVSQVAECFRFNDLDSNNLTTLEYSVCHDIPEYAGTGFTLSSETTNARNFLAHHVTVARMRSASVINGGIYARNGITSNVTIRDSIIDLDNGPNGHAIAFGETSALPQVLNFNGYTKNGAVVTFAYNGLEYNTLAAWRAATGRDANSQVFSTGSPFVDRANGNFRIAPGHPAMTASSTGGQIGAYAGSLSPGVDLGNTTAPAAPAAPARLRVAP
ncbi:MAG: hypothetical protein ACKVPX_00620 [Myxococcaceae bacterium]